MEIIRRECVGSTNDELKKMALQGARSGTVLTAVRQTGGRGRLGRSFESPPGGAYVSVLLTPSGVEGLTCAAAVAVRRAAEGFGADAEIKWPNDLVSGGRKLCGILTEMVTMGDKSFVIVGAGLNVNQSGEDFSPELRDKAVSLYMLTGRRFDCAEVAESMGRFIAELDGAETEGYMEQYRAHCSTLGKRVTSADGRSGTARGVERDGALRIVNDRGETEYIRFGEVTVQ